MSNRDKNIEELRDLLRKKLEESTPAEDGWNVPSEGVWAGVSEELAASASPSRSNTTRWLAVATAALLALLLLRECSHRGQVGDLEMELQNLEQSYEKLQRSCDEKTSLQQRGQAPPSTAPLTPAQAAPAPGQPSLPLMYFGGNERESFQHFAEKHQSNQAGATTVFQLKTANDETTALDRMAERGEFKLQQPPMLLPAAPAALFPIKKSDPKPNLHLPEGEKNSKSLNVIAHAYAGAALTGNRLAGEKPAIIARQKALLGWQTGIGMEAVFNRHWSLETGLRYGTHRIETDYALAVPYTHNGETQHDDGNFDNQYHHSLPSGLGNYPLQMVLTRESTATVEEGEVMRLDLHIKQRIQQLSLPLHLRYGFGKHRWQAGIRAGLVANHTLAVASEDHPALISHHGAIHQRHTSVGNPSISDLQKFSFDSSLGLDLRYQLTHRLGLSLAGSWQRAFTPVYDGAAVQSYLHSLGLNAGFHVWLR